MSKHERNKNERGKIENYTNENLGFRAKTPNPERNRISIIGRDIPTIGDMLI